MISFGRVWRTGWILVLIMYLGACATTHKKACTEGGQPPREGPGVFQGKKSCLQTQDPFTGKYLNDGKYYEWFPNEKIAIVGEYKMGKKTGRWIEYDEQGNKTLDKYYEEGKEIPRP